MAALLSFISKPQRLHFFLFGLNDAEVVISRIDQGNLEQIKAAQVCIHFPKQSANQRPRTKYILQFGQIQVCITVSQGRSQPIITCIRDFFACTLLSQP